MARWRTKEKKNLEEICGGTKFVKTIEDIPYCGLSISTKIGCKYQSQYPDLNHLYECCHIRFLDDIKEKPKKK